jgi:predicted GNAT family N-acyltransferase
MPTIELMDWVRARDEASRIRYEVFVEEQRVPVEIELDEHDPVCVHAIARSEDGTPVATGRLLPDGHIGRMAVTRAWRGRGVGSRMLVALMNAAQERGDAEVVLSAQTHAIGFYRRHGFAEEGPVYDDAGIPHQDMRRSLQAASGNS